jgi:hypothetical protein
MNEHDHHHADHDPELHDAGLSALYRQLPAEEPDANIDNAIRAAAHRALRMAPAKTAHPRRYTGWFAFAAMSLLCVGLVVQMQWQAPEQLQQILRTTPAVPEQMAEPIASDAPARASAQAAAPPAEFKKKSAKENTEVARARAPASTDTLNERPQEVVALEERASRYNAKPAAAPMPAPAPAPAPVVAAGVAKTEGAAKPDADAKQARRSLVVQPDSNETVAQMLDHDILQQLHALQSQTPRTPPSCASRRNDGQQPLCDLLILYAAGQPLPADWRQRLDAAGLWQGDFAYRHALLEQLFSR